MSVGGKVVEVIEVEPDKVWVNTQDYYWSPKKQARVPSKDLTAVYVNPLGNKIQLGDTIWWQGGTVYWTTADRSKVEVRLKKVGYSGVSRPEMKGAV